MFHEFSYVGYLFYSILLACAGSIDELAFNSILPMTITKGYEQQSYAISTMIYPMLNVIMVPAAALVMQTIGIPVLLLCPYGLMLANRLVCGSLGQTSGTLRMAAIQSYIPESMRARINSLQTLMFYGTSVIFSLFFGWIGDLISFEETFLLGAGLQMIVLYFTWIRYRKSCQAVFLAQPEPQQGKHGSENLKDTLEIT